MIANCNAVRQTSSNHKWHHSDKETHENSRPEEPNTIVQSPPRCHLRIKISTFVNLEGLFSSHDMPGVSRIFHLTWRLYINVNQTGPQNATNDISWPLLQTVPCKQWKQMFFKWVEKIVESCHANCIQVYKQKTDTVGQIHAYTSWSENLPNFSKSHQSLTRKIVNGTWAYQSQIRWLHLWRRAITTSQKKKSPCCNASAAETSTCHPWKILAGGKAGRHPGPVWYNKYPMNHNDFTPSILQQPSNTDLAFVEPVCPMGWDQVDERLYLHHRCRLQVISGVYGKNPNCFIVRHRFFWLCCCHWKIQFLSSLLLGQVFFPFLERLRMRAFWRHERQKYANKNSELRHFKQHATWKKRKWPSYYHFTARNT